MLYVVYDRVCGNILLRANKLLPSVRDFLLAGRIYLIELSPVLSPLVLYMIQPLGYLQGADSDLRYYLEFIGLCESPLTALDVMGSICSHAAPMIVKLIE